MTSNLLTISNLVLPTVVDKIILAALTGRYYQIFPTVGYLTTDQPFGMLGKLQAQHILYVFSLK